MQDTGISGIQTVMVDSNDGYWSENMSLDISEEKRNLVMATVIQTWKYEIGG